jgi:hypothetical protein
MRILTLFGLTAAVFLAACAHPSSALAGRPDPGRYPNLVQSWEKLQQARNHLKAAEAAHAAHGTLGGHGQLAVQAVDAAERNIDEAIAFAETHRRPGPGGVVTQKPPLVAHPDDVKYPNLGDARLEIEWAVRHVEDAMQFHGPIGTLGGHGERAVENMRRAMKEISEAEHFADTHR